ncbi:MAG: hypothetical protein MJE68_27965 [Proteobacteria bacterium]|nr:hypothetical protein [Pseudomonadota bacterium]
MFTRAKRGLQTINAKSKDAPDQERKVAKNVTTSLAISLQDLSVNFRKSQLSYLKSEFSGRYVYMYHPVYVHVHSCVFSLFLSLCPSPSHSLPLFFIPCIYRIRSIRHRGYY